MMNHRFSKRAACCATSLASLFLCDAGANAADWHFDPRVVVTGSYNDNYLLGTDPAKKISVFGSQADAGMLIHGDTPTSSLTLWPYVLGSYYPGHTDLNADLEFLDLTLTHLGEETKYAINADYSRRTLLEEILPTTDVNSDLGVSSRGTSPQALEERDRQGLLLLRPTAQVALTERSHLAFQGEYVDATYDRQIPGTYVNYQNLDGSIAWAYELSPRGILSFSGVASRFSSTSEGDTNTFGFQAEWYKLVTQTGKYYLRAGVNHTEFGASPVPLSGASASANTVSAGAGASWAFQVSTVFLDLTRFVNPSSTGVAVDQNQLRLRFERRWTPRMATFVGVIAVKQDPLGSASEALASSYATGTVGFEWRYQRALALVGAYSFTYLKLGDQLSTAEGNMVKLSLVYEPNRPDQSPAITVPY